MDILEERQKSETPLFLPPPDDEDMDIGDPSNGKIPAESLDEPAPKTEDSDGRPEYPPSSPQSEVVSLVDEDVNVSTAAPTVHDVRPTKKRRITQPHENVAANCTSYYLGSFLVSNAWSTVRGTGYIKNGDLIMIERDTLVQETSQANKDSKKKGKGKQMTINSMFKVPAKGSSTPKKTKANTIVRLTNARGFEFGRLPTDVSNWLSKLLDLGVIDFRGSTMVDCPEKLHSGADLLVSLSVYLLPSAFKRYTPDSSSSSTTNPKTWFNEGYETQEEEALRERKYSLQQMFEKLSLHPRAGESPPSFEKENIPPEGHVVPNNPSTQQSSRSVFVDAEDDKFGDPAEAESLEEVLSETDIDIIYRRAQANDAQMDEMNPSESFTLKLRPYQKQALHWMYSREVGTASARKTNSLHPLWTEYAFPPEPDQSGAIDLTAEDQLFFYNAHSGEISLEFPRAENLCRGGILADEMGMGKTIMVSSLIQTNRGEKTEEEIPDEPEVPKQPGKQKQLKLDAAFKPVIKQRPIRRRSRATLIIAPASLLDQWANEIRRSCQRGTVNVFVWHGQGREDLEAMIDVDIDAIDVVITSYGTLASEHARLEKSQTRAVPIYDIEWFRVVLDEAHNIKSRTSKSARATFDLRSPRRWALTGKLPFPGTPIVNRLEDLYSLLRFLEYAPWSDYSFFRSVVTHPFLNHEPKAIEVVQVILESVLLRREKNMRDRDGNVIIQLPSKEVKHERLEFSTLERKIYDSLYQHAKIDYDRLNEKGLVGKKYTHILAMLMRLRRAVLHPSLVLSDDADIEGASTQTGDGTVNINEMIRQFAQDEESDRAGEIYAHTVLKNLSVESDEECPVCMDIMEDPVLIPLCMHKCCKDCISAYLHGREEKGEEGTCPTCCQGPVKASELLEIVKRKRNREISVGIAPEATNDVNLPSSSPEVELRRNDFKSSTKLNALIQSLRRLQDQDPCYRAIIFSQFTSFLDLIETVLQREKLTWYRLDGSTEIKKRHQLISEFNNPSRKPKVFLLSLKAGGVGLNLTSANHVFMMDCWWNAAIEQQAIDRVHRIGQERTVFVTHFIVSDTIEGRILQIQKRKTAIIKEAFKGQKGSDSETMENLRIMFGEND